MTSSLFTHIEALQGDRPWGSFLDAGTGVNSALWSLGLATERWTGVTGASGHAHQVRARTGDALQARGRQLLVDNWANPELLKGQVFDTVLADYLVGAVEGFAPYFQRDLFRRLAPHVGGVLYIVGLDPYVVGPAETEAARLVREIGRLRDACLLLADETPYREYPAEWVQASLVEVGFTVTDARRFPNRYREKWVHGQLDMAARRLPRLVNRELASALAADVERLRERGVQLCQAQDGLRAGHDYVIACRPESSSFASVHPTRSTKGSNAVDD